MLKKLYALKNKKGFTLVELMVVVAILGILVAVAVPVYNNATEKAATTTCDTNCRTVESAIMQMEAVSGKKVEDGEITKATKVKSPEAADKALGDYLAGGEMPVCKVEGHKDFVYNLANGKVTHAAKG